LEEVFYIWFVLDRGPVNTHSDTWHVFSVLRGPCRDYIRESVVSRGRKEKLVAEE
jgi:hypothetical protein